MNLKNKEVLVEIAIRGAGKGKGMSVGLQLNDEIKSLSPRTIAALFAQEVLNMLENGEVIISKEQELIVEAHKKVNEGNLPEEEKQKYLDIIKNDIIQSVFEKSKYLADYISTIEGVENLRMVVFMDGESVITFRNYPANKDFLYSHIYNALDSGKRVKYSVSDVRDDTGEYKVMAITTELVLEAE